MLDHLRKSDSNFTGRCVLAFALAGVLVTAQGCSSDDTSATPDGGGAGGGGNTDGAGCPSGGGPLPGMATDACMGMFKTVGMCTQDDGGGGATDGGEEPLPEPAVGSSNNDDDCKYLVSFTNDCVQQGGTGTTFDVTLKSLTKNMMLVPGANAYVEAFLNENHPASGATDGTETSTGVYKIGPVIFDKPGKWTVRFHFFGNCSDTPEDSPHAHAAFFINVP
jgi:hypothetical protein